MNGCLGLGGIGRMRTANGYRVSFWSDGNVLKLWWQLCNSMNILKITELYTLNGCTVWYMSYILIKLLFKKIKMNHSTNNSLFKEKKYRKCSVFSSPQQCKFKYSPLIVRGHYRKLGRLVKLLSMKFKAQTFLCFGVLFFFLGSVQNDTSHI